VLSTVTGEKMAVLVRIFAVFFVQAVVAFSGCYDYTTIVRYRTTDGIRVISEKTFGVVLEKNAPIGTAVFLGGPDDDFALSQIAGSYLVKDERGIGIDYGLNIAVHRALPNESVERSSFSGMLLASSVDETTYEGSVNENIGSSFADRGHFMIGVSRTISDIETSASHTRVYVPLIIESDWQNIEYIKEKGKNRFTWLGVLAEVGVATVGLSVAAWGHYGGGGDVLTALGLVAGGVGAVMVPITAVGACFPDTETVPFVGPSAH